MEAPDHRTSGGTLDGTSRPPNQPPRFAGRSGRNGGIGRGGPVTGQVPIVTGDGIDREWYKDAVIYQLHVRAYQDSNGDGIGDFRGLTRRLDYIQDLGVTAIWLLPFYPSPLRDDGYDIADFRDVHPIYGTLKDFKAFLREAHARDLRVITEVTLNHTSDQHEWFQRARREEPGSRWRNFYVWSDTPERYADARIIFQDFEPSNWTWDPVAKQYFWHRFYSQQPDLNFESPDVRAEMFKIIDHWLQMGVDGLRLDAIPYLYEEEHTNCENLPQTHEFLRSVRRHVDEKFPGRMLLAEANQWPEDAVKYFGEGDGDECHMAFNFPLMPRMFMAMEMEDRFPIIDILQQTPEIPTTAQWAIFLRNHDELTLEMVTDEERDYMYRAYARDQQARINLGIRRRLAPLQRNDPARIRLMNGLLFALGGTPVVYYGDEIGMGDNIYLGDRNGVRTPMQWSSDRNAGFSSAAPQSLYLPVIIDPEYHYEQINVDSQLSNSASLLWWMRRLISLRKRHPVLARGSIDYLQPENHRVLAIVRRGDNEQMLVVANLSRHAQFVELDLAEFDGARPVELFGRTTFPTVTTAPYRLTLSPHSFFLLSLEAPGSEVRGGSPDFVPDAISMKTDNLAAVFNADNRAPLEAAITRFLPERRWFSGTAKSLTKVAISELIRIDPQSETLRAAIAILDVDYVDRPSERYVLPLSVRERVERDNREGLPPAALVARLAGPKTTGVLHDAMYDAEFCSVMLEALGRRRRLGGSGAAVVGVPVERHRDELIEVAGLEASVARGEQSNSSVIFGGRIIVKVFRRLEEGENPDLELVRALNEAGFEHVPKVVGSFEHRSGGAPPTTLAIAQHMVSHESDAWNYTIDALTQFYDRVLGESRGHYDWLHATVPALSVQSHEELPLFAREQLGSYFDLAHLLGERTAEMHLALVADRKSPGLAPEPITQLYQRSVHQSMRTTARRAIQLLRRSMPHLEDVELMQDALSVVHAENQILERFQSVLTGRMTGMRIRCHGDYHLGQVLTTGKDVLILDFEGEPGRPMSERRIKRSALRDVAGMIRSFHYATHAAVRLQTERGLIERGSVDHDALKHAGALWYGWVTSEFVRAYRERAGSADFMPSSDAEVDNLLDLYVLEKAAYEIGYELNFRPDWLEVPLSGMRDHLGLTGNGTGSTMRPAPRGRAVERQ